MTSIDEARVREILDGLGDDTFAGIIRTVELKIPEARALCTLALSALAAPVRDETEIKPTVARYAIALDGWLSCLEGAGTWDAPTLERVRICIGPIIDEMRSNTTVPDQPAEREQMARDWQLTMMKARSFIADNFVTGSFSDRTAAGKLLDQINTILENSFGQRALSQTSKPEGETR